MQDFEAWHGQEDAQTCAVCGRGGRVGRQMKPRDASARMALLGELIATDSSTPIMLERDCVHRDGGPYRMLTVSLDAQLHIAMSHILFFHTLPPTVQISHLHLGLPHHLQPPLLTHLLLLLHPSQTRPRHHHPRKLILSAYLNFCQTLPPLPLFFSGISCSFSIQLA